MLKYGQQNSIKSYNISKTLEIVAFQPFFFICSYH